jgi:fumarate reductase subunit C
MGFKNGNMDFESKNMDFMNKIIMGNINVTTNMFLYSLRIIFKVININIVIRLNRKTVKKNTLLKKIWTQSLVEELCVVALVKL